MNISLISRELQNLSRGAINIGTDEIQYCDVTVSHISMVAT